MVNIEVGRSYRLLREWEVRDEQTGTLRTYLLKGQVLKVKRVATEEEHVWVEGVAYPLPLSPLRRGVTPVVD